MNKDPKRKLPLSVKPDSRTDEETTRKRAYSSTWSEGWKTDMILRTGFALRKSCRERHALSQRDFTSIHRERRMP